MNIVLFHAYLLNAHPQTAAVIKKCVYEKACRKRESEQICYGVGRRKIERGILLVRGEVESVPDIEDAADVVYVTVAIVRAVLIHREISEIPGLCSAENSHNEVQECRQRTFV